MKKTIKNKIRSVILLLISFLVFSCSEETPLEPEPTFFDIQGENGFVGTVNGTDAFIAILVASDEAIAYVCNGDEEIHEWFWGEINDPTNISLTNSNGALISGQFSGSSFAGNVTLRNMDTYSFKATPNTEIETGLFRVYGDLATKLEVSAGWILSSASEERGSFKIQSVFQATPKMPKINDGTSNTILIGENSFQFGAFRLHTRQGKVLLPSDLYPIPRENKPLRN